MTKANIKKGNQVSYAPSGQAELIVNNNKKILTFNNVVFDRKNNIFYMDSDVATK